ncbi:MAG: TonB-dependent receptor plug domain-containing protein [Saprospiraceae bacterium]|nr:TonB-dependent receptor plug domain-containing protein [Saprospiraceae bacterium]
MLRLIIALLWILMAQMGWSQMIQGRILDNQEQPVVDAYILTYHSDQHAHTDQEGRFTIHGSLGDTLLVSHISFSTKVVVVDRLDNFIIHLEESLFSLEEVVVMPQIDALNAVTRIDLETQPVRSSQEVLRRVPGLFIGQHAGGGKAEQLFLRGFDLDHGTDIAVSVDGMPVNMVSHAHGQGYADLHFLIPELIDEIDFGKGPYYAKRGDFNTAGYVDFKRKERLDRSLIQQEIGQFNTRRTLGMLGFNNQQDQSAYLAGEFLRSDGPFESPQHFNRVNLTGSFTKRMENLDKWALLVSHFTSDWDASGQIPQRAVDEGLISRFGSIDDSEGGHTGRNDLKLDYQKTLGAADLVKTSFFISRYQFELYSNFTFFLEDPVNGDQIRQKEDRNILGFNSEWQHGLKGSVTGLFNAGIGYRYDVSNGIELSHTMNRSVTLQNIQLGDIHQSNYYGYLNAEFDLGRWVINPGMRVDWFDFAYQDHLEPTYHVDEVMKGIVSPKLNVLYNYSLQLQGYVKAGMGFHSNDTRVVVAQDGKKILPAARGMDVGFIWKPVPRLMVNLAGWYLGLDQEFVYVGDAGVVEPSGRTRRLGLDAGLRYQAADWLYFYGDFNYAHGRSIDDPEGENYIPLAPVWTSAGGMRLQGQRGWHGGLSYRFMGDRPANEDDSITASGYLVWDANAGYDFKRWGFGLQVINLFNTAWNETQFATTSRLFNETQPVEEIHFTPGSPFFLNAMIRFMF